MEKYVEVTKLQIYDIVHHQLVSLSGQNTSHIINTVWSHDVWPTDFVKVYFELIPIKYNHA